MSKERNTTTAQDYAELIRAITPIFLAFMGGLIGIFALLLSSDGGDNKLTSAMGLAGTAIAGASGLAQSSQSQENSNQAEDKNDAKNIEP
ncbi:MAG: hypothetical protein QNJ47_25920 [Nostocaceae cyanobacterium]|nr:hypothetical protein [Nostocaceae cyanobacterium]